MKARSVTRWTVVAVLGWLALGIGAACTTDTEQDNDGATRGATDESSGVLPDGGDVTDDRDPSGGSPGTGTATGSDTGSYTGTGDGGGGDSDASTGAPDPDMATDPGESAPPPPDPVSDNEHLPAGTLTAADWDDNLNFEFYLDYFEKAVDAMGQSRLPSLPAADRVVITVRDGQGAPVRGAQVTVAGEGGLEPVSFPTGSDGRVLFFPSLDGAALSYTVTAQVGDASTTSVIAPDQTNWSLVIADAPAKVATQLDLALVIDTTGSMSDELEYLQTELAWVVEHVAQSHADVDLRLGLVLYRDKGDVYEVRKFDFTADVGKFLNDLKAQSTAGGGDYPESMAEGLLAGLDLSWRGGDSVRVAFLVADAPPQADRTVTTVQAAIAARQKGIRIYPVAASGVADSAEWVMRQIAVFTLGRYIFLTDDSGVGNAHAEPHIPCYLVQKLNKLMVRVLDSELAGAWQYPVEEDIVRKAGDPQNGHCVAGESTYDY